VTKEYRRFLYLAARAGHPVTPPADIWPVREPAKLGVLGKTLLVAGGTLVIMAIALKAANIPLLIFVAILGILGILTYSYAGTAALTPDKRRGGCGGGGCGGAGGGGCGGGGCGGGGCG
jgi:hypothetical protein